MDRGAVLVQNETKTLKRDEAIGPVETPVRPEVSPAVKSAPQSSSSSGPSETGPHGQTDVTKPMPTQAPEAQRTAPDRPIKEEKK